jgi:hypothetical protein
MHATVCFNSETWTRFPTLEIENCVFFACRRDKRKKKRPVLRFAVPITKRHATRPAARGSPTRRSVTGPRASSYRLPSLTRNPAPLTAPRVMAPTGSLRSRPSPRANNPDGAAPGPPIYAVPTASPRPRVERRATAHARDLFRAAAWDPFRCGLRTGPARRRQGGPTLRKGQGGGQRALGSSEEREGVAVARWAGPPLSP